MWDGFGLQACRKSESGAWKWWKVRLLDLGSSCVKNVVSCCLPLFSACAQLVYSSKLLLLESIMSSYGRIMSWNGDRYCSESVGTGLEPGPGS